MTVRLIIIAVCGVVLLGGFITFIHNQRQDAARDERVKQEKENAQFSVKVNKGAVSFTVCDSADGVYDFAKGTCKLP